MPSPSPDDTQRKRSPSVVTRSLRRAVPTTDLMIALVTAAVVLTHSILDVIQHFMAPAPR